MIRLGLIFTVFGVVSIITAMPFGSIGYLRLPLFIYINPPLAMILFGSELGGVLYKLPGIVFIVICFLISTIFYFLVGGAIGLLIDSIREHNRKHF